MSENGLDTGSDAGGAAPAGDKNQGVNEFALAARRLSVSKETANVWLMMEDLVEKLKILNYETEFCAEKGLQPFNRTYFAQAASNASTQFSHLISLVSWLFKLLGNEFTVDKYDDPTTCANKLMLALKSLKFELEFPASRIKQGNGEAVLSVLHFLSDKALNKSGFKWAAPEYALVDAVEDAEVDADADLGAEIEDEAVESEEEEALFYEQRPEEHKTDTDWSGAREMIESDNSPEMQALWQTELERVAPRLKVNLSSVGNEWRVHLQQTRRHEQVIKTELPVTGKQLTQMGEALGETLEKISNKERSLHNQFEELAREHAAVHARMKEVSATFDVSGEQVDKLTGDLASISEQYEEIKQVMDSRGNSMTDTTPVQKVRKALAKIKQDIKTMDLRLGVVGHSITQAKLRNRALGDVEGSNPEDDDRMSEGTFDIENAF